MNSLFSNLSWLRAHRTLVLAVTLMAGLTGAAHSTNFSLWIHGRGGSGEVGNYHSWDYWGPSTVDGGVNKRSVNWNGTGHIADTNLKIRYALDCFCTGNNWCYIAAHSAGNLQIGYALAEFGGTTRNKKNGGPNSSGTCDNIGGTQTGWNIKWVDVAGGAAGGSELANAGAVYWGSDPIVTDLRTSTARAMYNHNTTRSKVFWMFAGAKGAAYSGVLPGQDDSAVAYHSSGGVSGSNAAYCNPSDFACHDLTMGTADTGSGSARYSEIVK